MEDHEECNRSIFKSLVRKQINSFSVILAEVKDGWLPVLPENFYAKPLANGKWQIKSFFNGMGEKTYEPIFDTKDEADSEVNEFIKLVSNS